MQKRNGGERARVTGRWDGSGGSILFCTSMKPVIRVSGWTRWIVPRLRGTLVSRWTRCWTTRGQRDFGRHWRPRREDKSFGNSMLRCKVRVFAPSIFVLKRDPESREIRMKIKKAHLRDNARKKGPFLWAWDVVSPRYLLIQVQTSVISITMQAACCCRRRRKPSCHLERRYLWRARMSGIKHADMPRACLRQAFSRDWLEPTNA